MDALIKYSVAMFFSIITKIILMYNCLMYRLVDLYVEKVAQNEALDMISVCSVQMVKRNVLLLSTHKMIFHFKRTQT